MASCLVSAVFLKTCLAGLFWENNNFKKDFIVFLKDDRSQWSCREHLVPGTVKRNGTIRNQSKGMPEEQGRNCPSVLGTAEAP